MRRRELIRVIGSFRSYIILLNLLTIELTLATVTGIGITGDGNDLVTKAVGHGHRVHASFVLRNTRSSIGADRWGSSAPSSVVVIVVSFAFADLAETSQIRSAEIGTAIKGAASVWLIAHSDPATSAQAPWNTNRGTAVSGRFVGPPLAAWGMSPSLGVAHPLHILGPSGEGSRFPSSPPGSKGVAPEFSPQSLLLEVFAELLCLLGTFLPLIAAPEQEKNEKEEQSTKDDKEDLPPRQFLATILDWLLGVGVEGWDRGWSAGVGRNDQFGHTDTKAAGRSSSTAAVDIDTRASAEHLFGRVAGQAGTSTSTRAGAARRVTGFAASRARVKVL
jgi:hypothetical protein